MTINVNINSPKIGEGIYLITDISKILNLDYKLVRRWIREYWDGSIKDNFNQAFGEKGNKAVNFYSLIEFYIFYKLREKGISAQELNKAHKAMSKELNTRYPFASKEIRCEKRKRKNSIWYKDIESLIRVDGKRQHTLEIIEDFLDRIEFGDNSLAQRFYPLSYSKNVVVDPKHQFGQPVISGTNIKTQTIYNLHKGGESYENISILYDISIQGVKDAISFQQVA
jgi:uncharacterized protein (DUF433 family)